MPQAQTLPEKVRAKYPSVYDDLSDADLDTKVRAKFPGVYDDIPKPTAGARGNIDLFAQPTVKNPDGTTSTVDSIGVNLDGKEYLLPTVTKDGRHFTGPKAVDQAVAEFRKTGQHLGVFNSVAESNAYAEQLHNDYAAGKYKARMSAAQRGTALPPDALATPNDAAFVRTAGLHAIADLKVTLADLKDRPVEAMQQIGAALKQDASDPRVWVNLAAAYFGPKVIGVAGPIVAKAAHTAGKVIAAVAPELPYGIGRAVKAAGKGIDAYKAVQAARNAAGEASAIVEAPVVTAPANPASLPPPRELARSMRPTGEAWEAAKAEAFQHATPPATPAVAAPPAAPPAAVPSAPPPAPPAAPTGQALMRMAKSGQLTAAETGQALKLLQQGVAPDVVEAQILAARPSAASVAPAAAPAPVSTAAADLSPVQKMMGVRPGVPPSNAQVLNGLGIAARRAKVTMTPQDVEALAPLVTNGTAPEVAIQQLPALKLQQMPGVMTPEQVAAEIAARKGNRSPTR